MLGDATRTASVATTRTQEHRQQRDRRQDEALARQGELRPDVDEDAEAVDGFVMILMKISLFSRSIAD